MGQKERLLAGLAALVAVLAAGLALTARLGSEAQEAESDETLALTDYAAGDLTALTYVWQGETVALERIEETTETDEGETETTTRWVLTGREAETVDQTLVNSMTTALGTLTADRDLGAQEALADFGLEEPALTVTAAVGEETFVYRFGDANEVTGQVYLMREGDDHLYTVGYTRRSVFQYSADELIQRITAEIEE